MTSAGNVSTNANKVSGQLLSVVPNIIPKEALKTHQTATDLMIQGRTRNCTLTKFESFTRENFREIRTFFKQKMVYPNARGVKCFE